MVIKKMGLIKILPVIFLLASPINILIREPISVNDKKVYDLSATTTVEYLLDQHQDLSNGEVAIHQGVLFAQSFQPSMTPLTKVIIKIKKILIINEPLIVSIRKNLTGKDIVFLPLLGSQIPFNTFWVEFDFNDIDVEINQTYYLVVRSTSSQSYWWLRQSNTSGDPYKRGQAWQSVDNGIHWGSLNDNNFFVDCAFQTYSYISQPDLQCKGTLRWTNITPGGSVIGDFTVENIGTPLSHLNWKIDSWSSWGTWTFSPSSGQNLKPEDNPIRVLVSIEAPNITKAKLTGMVKIININDVSDFCIIEASLNTSKIKEINYFQYCKHFEYFIKWIKEFNKCLIQFDSFQHQNE
jgi:hypothetical protein